MADFSTTTEASNPYVHTSVTPEGIYICTGNDIISYFRSGANRVHAAVAATDFTVTNDLVGKSRTVLKLAYSKFTATVPPGSYFDRK